MPEWSGDGIPVKDSKCPICGDQLEYNGNYWCASYRCPYVMGDFPEGRETFRKNSRDRRAWDSVQVPREGNRMKTLEDWRRWAINHMKWERAVATERSKRLPGLKGGEKRLNESVQAALLMSHHPRSGKAISPGTRAKVATRMIEKAVGLK